LYIYTDKIATIAKIPSIEQDDNFSTGPYGRTNDRTTLRKNERIHIVLFIYMMLCILMTLKNNVLFPNVKSKAAKFAIV